MYVCQKFSVNRGPLDVSDAVAEVGDDELRGLALLPLAVAGRHLGLGQVGEVGLGDLELAAAGEVGAEAGHPAPDLVLEEAGDVVERREDEDGRDEGAGAQVVLQPVEREAERHVTATATQKKTCRDAENVWQKNRR